MFKRCAYSATLAVVLAWSGLARADQIGYTYDWSTTTPAVTGDDGNFGAISFATPATLHANGTATLTAASLAVVTSAPGNNPDTFSGQAFNLTLLLTDDPSGKSGSLFFTGKLFGTLTASTANINPTFDAPSTQQLKLGADVYTVTLGHLVRPADANQTVIGDLEATVAVQAATNPPPVSQAPEPSSLILTLLGMAGAAAARIPAGRKAASPCE